MHAQPMVSVVVPTCDRCALTKRCLEALFGQAYANLEIIVVDDA